MGDEIRLNVDDVTYEDEDIEDVDEFEFDGYQVVRREFYAHLRDPSVSYKVDSVQFNAACINKLSSLYVQLLVNPKEKKMVIKECDEDAKDALRWCRINKKTQKKVPRIIKSKIFSGMIYELMGWNPEYKYKLQGNLIRYEGEILVVFNMSETEIYTPITKDADGNKVKSIPYYPEDWKNSFGLSIKEHSQSTVVNLIEGYQRLEYQITSRKKTKKADSAPKQTSIFDLSGGGINGDK